MANPEYRKFLAGKQQKVACAGFSVEPAALGGALFPWQRDIVVWALRKGRAALFEDCGLGKTVQQLAWARQVSRHTRMPVLIVAPLVVSEQTRREGLRFGFDVAVCRRQEDVSPGINVTNYEMLPHFDAGAFGGVVLDESSILKNYAGKIRTQIIDMFRATPYKLSCTATPSPNDYMELGNQAEFLGVMSRTEMLSVFFTHDGGDTSKWRLKGHSRGAFWAWVAQWAVVLTTPADLGYPAEGYELPGLTLHEHTVPPDRPMAGDSLSLFTREAKTLTERRQARRNSLEARCRKAAELTAGDGQWLLWCDLNDESGLLASLIPGAVEIRGSDSPEVKAERLRAFTDGICRVLVTKPSIAGFGLNWQGCHNMAFVGLSDSYEMMYQAIRRCYRFGQRQEVHVHIVISEEEGAVRANIERKERQSAEMVAEMVRHTKTILEEEIRGTAREVTAYAPAVEMVIPDWLAA